MKPAEIELAPQAVSLVDDVRPGGPSDLPPEQIRVVSPIPRL
jgi:hypothetical protein